MRRADKQKQAGKADNHSGKNPGGGLVATWAEPIEENHPQANGGDEEGGDAGGDGLFGPANASVTEKQKQTAGDRGGLPMFRGRLNSGFPAQNQVQD